MIDETLEIGTRESAVEAFVNLMSAALNMPEKKLHYWLDCYYQLRQAYESELRGKELVEALEGVEVVAGTGGHASTPPPTNRPTGWESILRSAENIETPPIRFIAPDGTVISPSASPIGMATPAAEAPEKPAEETPKKSAKTSIKQETHARLMAAREKGVTIAQLHAASGKKLTESDICGMLNSMPLAVAKWKLMKNALGKIESEEGEK